VDGADHNVSCRNFSGEELAHHSAAEKRLTSTTFSVTTTFLSLLAWFMTLLIRQSFEHSAEKATANPDENSHGHAMQATSHPL